MTMPETQSFHALRFGRSAARYEELAGVQARMGDALITLWGERPAPTRILEFGCGTGLLTRRLAARFPAASILATDASEDMLAIARDAVNTDTARKSSDHPEHLSHVSLRVLDARGGSPDSSSSSLSDHPADLLASGAVVQWFPDLSKHLRFASDLSVSGAAYLVSGFDRANFPELNAILAEPPFSYREYPGHTQAGVESAAVATGWTVAGFLSWDETEVLPSARAVLKRMQDLGSVRDPRAGGRMSRANLAHLLAEYERRFSVTRSATTSGNEEARAGTETRGVRLTWKPWAALLIRV